MTIKINSQAKSLEHEKKNERSNIKIQITQHFYFMKSTFSSNVNY
jgi:hypothetical protein